MMASNKVKVMNLFDAYEENKLPHDKAFIVSSFINESGYSIYEVISYSGVKEIFKGGDGLTFKAQGKKLYILIEPASYPKKSIEPYLRDKGEVIPARFNELDLITCKNQVRIYIGKKPYESISAFTITQPVGFGVSFVFFNLDDIYSNIAAFFEMSFNKDAKVPQSDAKKAAKKTADTIKTTMSFPEGEE
jgi:hypothetical protein